MELAREALVLDPRDPLDVRGPLVDERLELAAADEPKRQLGERACGREHRLETVQRDQLADEQHGERLRRRPAGAEDPLLRADEGNLDLLARQPAELGQVVGVRARVGDHEIGPSERMPVDARKRTCGDRAGLEAPAVGDEGVRERDERVEDHRTSMRGASGRGQIEVAGVADDQRVEVGRRPPKQLQLGEPEPNRGAGTGAPVVPAPLPDRHVPLLDVHPRAPQAGDHLRVARVVPLVGPEVEDAHALPGG